MEPVPIFTSKVGNFVKQESKPPLEALQSTTDEEYLKKAENDDVLLRYVGTYEDVNDGKLNNYICFGTDNEEECTSNPDKYMYRIIGITDKADENIGLQKGQLKVIKATSLKEDNGDVNTLQWAGNYTSNEPWDYGNTISSSGAILRYYLNNDFYSTIDSIWKSKITIQQWYKGDATLDYFNNTGITNEKKIITNDFYNPKGYPIGLMYASDYYNSWTYEQNTNSWLNICHGLSSGSQKCGDMVYSYEWTMTRNGSDFGGYLNVWYIAPFGNLQKVWPTSSFAFRPVFYLTSNIEISGKGSEDKPFIIVPEEPKPAIDKLQSTTSEDYLKKAENDDVLLRYIGTYEDVDAGRINNYICFGTDNKEECTSNPDKYMYRIIGVTDGTEESTLGLKAGMLKVIKATPVKENSSVKAIAWAVDYSSDIDWDNGSNTVRIYLNNGTNGFLKTINDMGGSWSNLISNPKWYIGYNYSYPWSSKTETDKISLSENHKIGLMYASDFYNSKNTYNTSSPYNNDSWLHITHGTSSSTTYYSTYEWTMTRYGDYYGEYYAWRVGTSGTLDWVSVASGYAVRPVFYLIPDITLTGSGTESNPFIISA